MVNGGSMALEEKEVLLSPLVNYVLNCFDRAKQAKAKIEERMVKNLRAFKCEYPSEKLARIRELGGRRYLSL